MAPVRFKDERDVDRALPTLRVVSGGVTSERREEDALVAAFLVGDDDAFGELVRRNERLVLSIVRRYTRASDEARDLAQRTFLRAFEAARRALRGGSRQEKVPFRHWLVRVAVNLAKNHVRDEARRARAPLSLAGVAADELGARAAAGHPVELVDLFDPLGVMERAEQSARLHRGVLRLPRRQREVLTLRLDAELPFAEIAGALGITENAAKVTFHHATRRLRDLLASDERDEEYQP